MLEQESGLIFQELNVVEIVFKMNYKEAIKESMELIAKKENSIFLGYNVSFGSKAYGTMDNIPESKKIETPVAENLMAGLAIGLSLEGFLPVLFFERHDFMLNAMDAIVNHADKINNMSNNQFKTPMIIRATIGSCSPLDPGPQHTQDFTEIFKKSMNFPIFCPKNPSEVKDAYQKAMVTDGPIMIIEKRDLFNVTD
jgi:pyruvate/2-oxoglutarate/acetoin dehydrogenase E1 component